MHNETPYHESEFIRTECQNNSSFHFRNSRKITERIICDRFNCFDSRQTHSILTFLFFFSFFFPLLFFLIPRNSFPSSDLKTSGNILEFSQNHHCSRFRFYQLLRSSICLRQHLFQLSLSFTRFKPLSFCLASYQACFFFLPPPLNRCTS